MPDTYDEAAGVDTSVKTNYTYEYQEVIFETDSTEVDTGTGRKIPSLVTVPAEVSISSPAVAGAAGVVNSAIAGQFVYSVGGGPNQSSGGGTSNANASNSNNGISNNSKRVKKLNE